MGNEILASAIEQFRSYKKLGERAMDQVSEDDINWTANGQINSIAITVKHLWGNMLSRWTDFLTSDGEKEWRDRDGEFTGTFHSKQEMLAKWEDGWQCLLETLNTLTSEQLDLPITIRGERHSVIAAIHRQLAHYSSHVGQIVLLAKLLAGNKWQSLSIAKGQSKEFTEQKFKENTDLSK